MADLARLASAKSLFFAYSRVIIEEVRRFRTCKKISDRYARKRLYTSYDHKDFHRAVTFCTETNVPLDKLSIQPTLPDWLPDIE